MTSALELRQVSKVSGAGKTEVRALGDVDLTVEPGELVAIMGPSGSGKSTLLTIDGSLEAASSGHVLVDDGADQLGQADAPVRAGPQLFQKRPVHQLQPLDDVENFADDSLYTKVVARRMLEMTRHINGAWTDHVAETGVTCYTCHRGELVPPNIWFNDPGPKVASACSTCSEAVVN